MCLNVSFNSVYTRIAQSDINRWHCKPILILELKFGAFNQSGMIVATFDEVNFYIAIIESVLLLCLMPGKPTYFFLGWQYLVMAIFNPFLG